MKIDELWEDTPIEEGRYLWRLGPASDVYQMCYVVGNIRGDLVSHATSVQLWGNLSETYMGNPICDGETCKDIPGQWLLITLRVKIN